MVTTRAGATLTTGFIVGASWPKAPTLSKASEYPNSRFIRLRGYPSHHCDSRLPLRLYRLALIERLFDVVHEHTAALQAKLACYKLAVPVDKEGGRQHANAAITLPYRLFAQQDRVIHPHLPDELGNVLGAGLVHGYAHNLKSLGAVFLLQLDKPGHLDFARTAPCRPEIEQNGLASEIRELHVLALERLQVKIGGILSMQLP